MYLQNNAITREDALVKQFVKVIMCSRRTGKSLEAAKLFLRFNELAPGLLGLAQTFVV
jgi:hypothetical protein